MKVRGAVATFWNQQKIDEKTGMPDPFRQYLITASERGAKVMPIAEETEKADGATYESINDAFAALTALNRGLSAKLSGKFDFQAE